MSSQGCIRNYTLHSSGLGVLLTCFLFFSFLKSFWRLSYGFSLVRLKLGLGLWLTQKNCGNRVSQRGLRGLRGLGVVIKVSFWDMHSSLVVDRIVGIDWSVR